MPAPLVQQLCASQGDKGKERGGVVRTFLSALQALDETLKFLAFERPSARPPTRGGLMLAIRDFLHLSLNKWERQRRPV